MFIHIALLLRESIADHNLFDERSKHLNNGGPYTFIFLPKSFYDIFLRFYSFSDHVMVDGVQHVFIGQNNLFHQQHGRSSHSPRLIILINVTIHIVIVTIFIFFIHFFLLFIFDTTVQIGIHGQ